MNPFKDREDAMMWYYNTHRMPESPLPQSPQNIIDYFPPQQWQMPTEPIPTEPTEPAATDPATQKAPDHFVLDYNHPDGGYWKEGTESTWIRYPGGGYWSGGDIPDKAMEYYKSLENEGLMSSDSLLPIMPISDSITTPLPDSGLLAPENLPQEERDYPEHIEPYDHEGFSSYLDSLPPGQHSYESVLEGFTGRKLTPQEESALDPFPNQPIRNLFGEPEDYTSNMPMIDPDEPSPPPNSDGLMGIVGGGIIDPGPVFDMQTAEGYEAYLNSL